jgi:hypothetical protein
MGHESVVGLPYGSDPRSRSSLYGAGMAGVGSGSGWNEKDAEDGYDHEVDGVGGKSWLRIGQTLFLV